MGEMSLTDILIVVGVILFGCVAYTFAIWCLVRGATAGRPEPPVDEFTADDMRAARKWLNEKSVPTRGRMGYDPERMMFVDLDEEGEP